MTRRVPIEGGNNTAVAVSGPLTDSQLRASAVPVSGTVAVGNTTLAVTQSGTWNVNTGLSQPLTDTQLRASAVPVSFTRIASGTDSITAVQSGTWAQNLTQVNGASLSLGQKTASASLPVVLSSDGPFAVNFGVTTDSAVTDPTATASHIALQKGQLSKLESVRALLAGTIATAANQTTANTSLSNIDGGIGGASAAAAGDTGASTTNGFLRWMRDFWLSLKGTKTAANSVSVTGASDGVFYVGGVSPDGVAPTNQAVRVSGIDGGGLKRTLLTDNTGIQYFRTPDGYSASSATALQALNDTFPAGGVGLAVPGWARSCTFYIYGTFSQTATLQISFDNAATWIAPGYLKNLSTGGYLPNVATANQPIVFDIPPGVTHIQVKCTTYGSGTAGVLLAYSAAQVTAFTTAALTQSTSRAGCVFAPGIWYDDTSSALNASATFTSTARDVTATSSGSAFSSASTNAKEFRVMAEQDVAFTLQIQASRDNSTFRIVESITAAAVPGGGFVASASVAPMWRYYRYAIVNGGTNAARTTGGSILMAN